MEILKCIFKTNLLFKNIPLNIISGTKIGADKPKATVTDGAAAEINDP